MLPVVRLASLRIKSNLLVKSSSKAAAADTDGAGMLAPGACVWWARQHGAVVKAQAELRLGMRAVHLGARGSTRFSK